MADISEHRRAALRRYDRCYRQNHPEKIICRRASNHAIRDGKIIRPPTCSACGQSNGVIQGHHSDYAKPCHVQWLCRSCHDNLHTKEHVIKLYRNKACKCGTWFRPTSGNQRQCIACRIRAERKLAHERSII